MQKPESIFNVQPEHGEGPIWCHKENNFYFVDLLKGNYYKIDWNSGAINKYDIGQEVGVIALREKGGIVAAVRDGFGFYDERKRQLKLIPNSPELQVKKTRMNDGAVDPAGRFFAGTMEYDGANSSGNLYRLNHDHSYEHLESNINIPNGMGWSPDKKIYYMIDTPKHVMYAYEYDIETGNISNRRDFIKWSSTEFPDGMTIDANGGFWVAMWEGYKISHFDSLGKWMMDIPVPVKHTTSCCFGGTDLKTLLITTSQLNLSNQEKKKNPLAGRCFAFETDTEGQIETRYKG